jgi:hypothetical protein
MTRRARASVVGALLVVASIVSVTGSGTGAGAQTGGGELGPDYVARAGDLGAGSFPGNGLPSAAPDVVSLYEWSRADTGGRCVVFAGPVPAALAGAVSPLPGLAVFPYSPLQVGVLQGAPAGAVRVDDTGPLPPGAIDAGTFVVDVATPHAGGPGSFAVPRCAPPGTPLPPDPPSAAEIWQQTPLPRATAHASPPGTRAWPGVVNLESRFWAAGLPDTRAAVGLDGFVVDVVARPVAYAWSFGDGTTAVAAGPGGPDAPARATFRRRGDFAVVLYVTWAGLAHVTAPGLGLDFGTQYLGTVTLPEPVAYHEAEIRALLRSRAARG